MLVFSGFAVKSKLILLALCLQKSHFWGNSGSSVMNQNVLSQSHCRILQSYISIEKTMNQLDFWNELKIKESQKMVCKFLVGYS